MRFVKDSDRLAQSTYKLVTLILNELQNMRNDMATWQEIADQMTAGVHGLEDFESSVEQLFSNQAKVVLDLRDRIKDNMDAASVKSQLESIATALNNSGAKAAAFLAANTPAAEVVDTQPVPAPADSAPAAPAAPAVPQEAPVPSSGSGTPSQ